MDGDELFLLVVSLISGFAAAFHWGRITQIARRFARSSHVQLPLYIIPALCIGIIVIGLVRWGATNVRHDPGYLVLLISLGVGWLGIITALLRWFGVSLRDDAVERGNKAAAIAWAGGILGGAFAYAGSNIGEGPSLWNNVFCAVVTTMGITLALIAVNYLASTFDAVTIERDVASGLRLGAFIAALGLIFGRAVAGDWHSADATMKDFAGEAWPAAFLTLTAAFVDNAMRPSRDRSVPPWFSRGILPAVAYVAIAAAWVSKLGRWEGIR